MSRALHSVVVAVGDELLLGTTVDTNGPWLSDRLALLGLPVLRREVIGDSDYEIHRAVRAHRGTARLIIFMGGLGPTPDDRTREALASALGRKLELDPDILDALEARFRTHGRGGFPASNRRQAMVPAGARVLDNQRGTAPGLVMEADGTWVACLPGPPRELRALYDDQLEPFLREALEKELIPVIHRTVRTTGIAESALADRADELLAGHGGPVELAFLPGLRGVDLRFTVRGMDAKQAHREIDAFEACLVPAVGRYRFDAPGGDLVEALARAMVDQGDTLSVAESCTGGLVASRLTEFPGASQFFVGGVVAYDNRAKQTLLDVGADTMEKHGAVSEQVLVEMLDGVRGRLGTEGAIALTGVAGPGGGTATKPVGTVWYGAALGGRRSVACRQFAGDRQAVRERSAQEALAKMFNFYRPMVS